MVNEVMNALCRDEQAARYKKEIGDEDTWSAIHQEKMKWHSQYSDHFEIQVRLFSIMQCTLDGNILSQIVFISLRDFQTWYSLPKGV